MRLLEMTLTSLSISSVRRALACRHSIQHLISRQRESPSQTADGPALLPACASSLLTLFHPLSPPYFSLSLSLSPITVSLSFFSPRATRPYRTRFPPRRRAWPPLRTPPPARRRSRRGRRRRKLSPRPPRRLLPPRRRKDHRRTCGGSGTGPGLLRRTADLHRRAAAAGRS